MVSVIIPTYNREKLIKRAIQSVLNQTFEDIEVIVVDDASTDNTASIVSNIKDNRLQYIKLEKNGGACRARNIGINSAKGEFISFLDSDDEWMEDKVEVQYNYLVQTGAIAVACNFLYKKGDKESLVISNEHPEKFTLNELLYKNLITTGALFIRREALIEVGCFDEEMPRYQDWDLVLRIAQLYTIYFVPQVLLKVYFQTDSITSSTSKRKKYLALCNLYEKNSKNIEPNSDVASHFYWSMGLYSLFTDCARPDLIWKSIKIDKFNVKKIIAFLAIKIGLTEIVKALYGRNH